MAVDYFDVLEDDQLSVYEGADEKGLALHQEGGFGGTKRPPSSFVSRNGKFFVKFVSNPVMAGRGFNLTYSISKKIKRLN